MGNSMKKNKNASLYNPAPVQDNQVPPENQGPNQKNGGVVQRRKRGKKNKKDRSKKGLSCPPDIGDGAINNGGATPYKPQSEEAPRVKIKLYRSYADLDRFMQEKLRQSRPDLKWYRRSTGSLERVNKRDRTKSLPKNYEMDYSRDSGNESAGGSFVNGAVMSESGTPGSEHNQPQWTSTSRQTLPGPTLTSTPSNNNTLPPKDGRRSNASSNSQSIPSVPESPMSNFDFPPPLEVKRKLELFEDTFRRSLLFKYQSLDEHLQLSKLGVAKPGMYGQPDVSLLQYVDTSSRLPVDLVKSHHRITVPSSVYRQLQYIKAKGITDQKLWRVMALDAVDGIGLEVGRELSRMYEYQIVSLAEDVSIQLLAAHATDCVMEYITISKVLIDRNSAIRGVIKVRPPPSEELNTVFSVLIGSKEFQWELYDIFKRPGLRKEVESHDYHNSSSEDEALVSSYHSPYPWNFYVTPADCEPQKYGYRGQTIEWDFAANVYKLSTEEERAYSQTKGYSSSDIHQHYVPYSHLVTAEKMQMYLDHMRNLSSPVGPPFVEFLRQDRRYVDRDGEDLFIYRPMSPLGRHINWNKAVLDNMDLTRLQIQNERSFPSSLRNSRLLLARITHAHMNPRKPTTDGCDLSYSTWVCYAGGVGGRTKPHMVCLEDVEGVDRSKNPGEAMIIDKLGRTVSVEDDIKRKEAQLEGNQKAPPPDVLVDYNYNVAERRSIHVLKTLQEDEVDGERGRTSSRGSSVSGPATIRRRKKRRKAGSSASESSGQSSALSSVEPNTSAETTSGHQQIPTTGQKYLRVDPNRQRPKSATLVRERTPVMDAQQQLMQPRTPPLVGPFRPPPQGRYHRRVMSSNQAGFEEHQAGNNNTVSPTNMYQTPDGRVYTLPMLHKSRGRETRHGVEGPVIPLDPRKDVLSEIEECPGAVYFTKVATKGVGKLFGRQDELAHVASVYNAGHRGVTITGCPGLGKSAFALYTGAALRELAFLPILVNCRGCSTWTRVCGRLMKQLGLRLPLQHVSMLRSWLSSYEQKVLLIIDNLELSQEEEEKVAEFLCELQEAENLYLLVTSRRPIQYPGFKTIHTLNNISGESSLALLRHQVPDLPDDTMEELVVLSEQVPYTMSLIAQGLRSGLLDSVEVLAALQGRPRPLDFDPEERFRLSDQDREMMMRMLSIVKNILEYLPDSYRELLRELTVFDGPVQLSTAKEVLAETDAVNTLCSLLNEAPSFGIIEYDAVNETVFIPDVVRQIIENEASVSTFQMRTEYCLNALNNQCQRYHSKEAYEALDTLSKDYDVVLETLMDISLREDIFDKIRPITNQEMCMFLNDVLESSEFTKLYENISKTASQMSDVKTEYCAQCCLAYHLYDTGEYSSALTAGEKALRLQANCEAGGPTLPKDFCAICLGKIYWRTAEDDKEVRESGFTMVKGAVDSLKNTHGLHHILTVYGYEDYIIMEKDREHYQKARYLYNVLDFIAEEKLGLHPDRIRGYNSRREIWERQGLFVRAAEVAKKAAEASFKYYGEHVITANMYSHWCECLVKAGDAAEANRACAISLGIREKLLGTHRDTALSNKMYAYLMLRGGHYDHSLMYGQRALEMSQKINTQQKFLKDLELILKHAYRRQQAMQAGYIRMETQKGKRVSCSPPKNGAVYDGNLNSISTEV